MEMPVLAPTMTDPVIHSICSCFIQLRVAARACASLRVNCASSCSALYNRDRNQVLSQIKNVDQKVNIYIHQ